MLDFLVLIAMYVAAAALGGIGLYFFFKQTKSKPPRDEKQTHLTAVATEDMLPGWGKEEEKAKT
ncbi:MAG TPA: hypothetical protein VJ869_09440 [Sphaerochaeta sp.]|nr:hypothetical protein [Sphaerochaeta sp.]